MAVRRIGVTGSGKAALSLALLAGAVMAQSGYTFSLGGKPLWTGAGLDSSYSGVMSLHGTPDAPASGDLLWLAACPPCLVRLGEPGHYEFFDDEGGVRLRRGDREQVAVLDSQHLVGADEAIRRDLLGVVVEHWDENVAAAIATLDPLVPLVVTDGAAIGEKRALPDLPPAFQHLALWYDTQSGFQDLGAAARLTQLRALLVGGRCRGYTQVDLRPFANAGQLRAFHCDQSKIAGAEVVQGFRELRSFAATDFPMPTFAMLQAMTELRLVWCWGPRDVELSLAPLADLPRLEHLELRRMTIRELPATGFDALRTLSLQKCGIPAAQLRAFRRSHPRCERIEGAVDDERLQTVLATADRLVLRTGGTCHREMTREKVLFETVAADEIAKVALLLRVEEGRGYDCRCCGSPTLVFFAAGKVIASIGVHHGWLIRWSDGPWESDAVLLAGRDLAQWLAAHGDDDSRRSLLAAQARADARLHRARLRGSVVGATIADGADLDQLGTEWLQRAADAAATDGGITQLRLLGCHEGAWNELDDFDEALLAAVLESTAKTTAWQDVIARCRADERTALGLAALWVADQGAWLPSERRTEALPIVAGPALRSPQPWNRARMLQRLRDDARDAACDVLLAALDGAFAARHASDEELIAPGRKQVVHPTDPVLSGSHLSTPTLAAVCLAARKYTAALPKIRELAKNAAESDAELLRVAIAQLERVQ